jgi:hypothetical protein
MDGSRYGLTDTWVLQIVAQTALSDESDKPFWKWTKSGKFTVGSVYKHL